MNNMLDLLEVVTLGLIGISFAAICLWLLVLFAYFLGDLL
jgi:hypothetical protein